MADDIVAIGGSRPGADERFEALFRAEYRDLVIASGSSERQAQQAFLRLWRMRWLVRDPQAAARYLRRDAHGPARAPGAADVDRAWLEFQKLRSRGRRRLAFGVVGAAAAVLIAGGALALAGRLASGQQAPSHPRALARPPQIPPSDLWNRTSGQDSRERRSPAGLGATGGRITWPARAGPTRSITA